MNGTNGHGAQPNRGGLPPLENSRDKNVFVMLRYREGDEFRRIEDIIRNHLLQFGLYARFAKDVRKADLLWANITRYMDLCRYGIAVFDGYPVLRGEPRLNPNVCTELGYMLAKSQERECLILRDKAVQDSHTDLKGFVVDHYDGTRLATLEEKISEWVKQVIHVLPLLQGFATLMPGTKIAQRLNEHAREKLAIGKYIAEEYLPENIEGGGLILDSGTTAASVAEALLLSKSKGGYGFDVYTNNLLASILLSSVSSIHCELVPGAVDQDFAGVFGPKADAAIKEVPASVAIVACTSFTAERGPHANSEENRSFKRAIIDKTRKTVIAVTAEHVGLSDGEPVLENERDWRRVLQEHVDLIVTSPGPEATKLRKLFHGKVEIVAP